MGSKPVDKQQVDKQQGDKQRVDRFRIHPPLDTNQLDLKWIDYWANTNLVEMFSVDGTHLEHRACSFTT